MKNLLFLLLVLTVAATPQLANAFNDGALIRSGVMYYEADDECAIETEFTSFDGGGNIFGTEGIFVNGVQWADLSQLPKSGYQAGDRISWGTEALSIKWDYEFDVTLKADICLGLKLGDQISYRGSGGSDLTSYDLTQEPAVMGAYNYNGNTGAYDYVDLNTNRLMISSLWTGLTISFGDGIPPSTGGGGGGTGGGCSLAMAMSAPISLSGWFGLAGFLTLMGWRRFRK